MKSVKAVKCQIAVTRDERKASQGFVDMKKKTVEQLDELIERQNKLLQNRFFLEKLPDKGEKILSFKAQLEMERKKKQLECDVACDLLSSLTLDDINVNEIEWSQEKSEINKCQSDFGEKNIKEDIDVLRVLANHSGTASGKNGNSDLSGVDLNNERKRFYVDKFCEKYGKVEQFKERFKPNQLRNKDRSIYINSAEKVKKILGSKWEVTEATPPVPIYNDTVMICLSESLKLQKKQAETLKEINKKHAQEKLLENMCFKMGDKLPLHNVTEYRSSSCPFDDDDNDFDNEEEEENGFSTQ